MIGRLRTLLLLVLLLLVLVSSWAGDAIHRENFDDEDDDDDEDDYDDDDYDDDDDDDEFQYRHETPFSSSFSNEPLELTDHQETLQKTTVDFADTDLTGDAASAARHAVDTMAAQFLAQGRLEDLFANARSPECRALIAQHFAHHVMAIAKEEPLPFVDVQFSNTCEDEQHWDFNNLPKGVHMGVSTVVAMIENGCSCF